MERDSALRSLLAVFLFFQAASVSASSLPSFDRGAELDASPASSPSAWTSQLGAIDRYARQAELPATSAAGAWDGAMATYNVITAPRLARDPSVFVPVALPRRAAEAVAPPLAATIRASITESALPAPTAWWVLLAGLLGVVGIARRRIV
jgi:hypothetical protein